MFRLSHDGVIDGILAFMLHLQTLTSFGSCDGKMTPLAEPKLSVVVYRFSMYLPK